MKVAILSTQTPFIHGGAFIMAKSLKKALKSKGHEAQIISAPFSFFPANRIKDSIDFWKKQDLNSINGIKIDRVISLQFPTYYASHHNKTLWLMHQHRAVYDLYDELKAPADIKNLKDAIISDDNHYLKTYKKRFTISKRVSQRLKNYNNIQSSHLYHPPEDEDKFYTEDSCDYVFYPSRLSALKRQDLLIKALTYTKSPLKVIIAGVGSHQKEYQNLINTLNLNHKVKLIGFISQKEKFAFYANALAVAFIPKDEDYGYITLEAMLSSKPLITTTDSGGVLEFAKDKESALVSKADPKELADSMDWLYYNKHKAKDMGKNALHLYKSLDISWHNTLSALLAES